MQKEYNIILRQAKKDGYNLDDDTFEYLIKYAKRKAKVVGKDDSYILYLLPDVIKEYFFRDGLNKIMMATVEF